ncbi:MAG: sigma-54-dependent Fis family transcriptional regulator [Geobacteraceae bacterium GWC2_58_44]|nr:MAG: sigma-54-dependent Fis family transcriptional regulator [Geobacteraceae bacterium GWC2_58_44]
MAKAKLLMVEDDHLLGELMRESLEEAGYRVRLARNGAQALEAVTEESFDLVLQDIQLPDADGLDLLDQILHRQPHCQALVMTAYATVEKAVKAMKIGAFDFLIKPFSMDVLFLKLEKVLEFRQMEKEIEALRGDGEEGSFVSRSPAMAHVLETVRAAAPTDAAVLLLGESGTGKELLCDMVHAGSARRRKPCVKINCAAIPETLMESELFGVERGAFTGADRSRPGYVESAAGGTLFLDEIGDLPLAMQGKLLRVLQEKKAFRVGGSRELSTDFRLVAATNCNLREMVARRRFREDLFYRINVMPIIIPPLRERREDIPLLIAHFQKRLAKADVGKAVEFTAEALEVLHHYDFPGNVRELKNIVEQLTIRFSGENIKARQIPVSLHKDSRLGSVFESFTVDRPLREAVAEFEARYIEKVLAGTGGNKSHAARVLGLSRQMLWEKTKRQQD